MSFHLGSLSVAPSMFPDLDGPVASYDGDVMMHGPRPGKIPGTRCPTCALAGKEVWVSPGRECGYCGTPCDGDDLHHEH